jgi:UDP-GlcNAc:undecaprenyl-phosphate GlcNAc-1-phosphate transferase
MNAWIPFAISFLISLSLIPVIRKINLRYGKVAIPREDRWHQTPTPSLGGIGIFIAFVITLIFVGLFLILKTSGNSPRFVIDEAIPEFRWSFLVGSLIIFLLGLYDDLKHISPQAKLVGQIIAAVVVVGLGYTTNFFTPKLDNQIVAQLPNILLTVIWLVGITNAINLLDNMDGLAGGISLITSLILSYFFWKAGDFSLLFVSMALAGSLLGFLIYNFPPASIFMGDSGSMFIGFTLAVMAIARQPQASNVFAVLGVPTLLFLLPILDTTLVTVTRILRGRSPAQGGRDHASHRLIAFGLTERKAVVVLYIVAVLSGFAAIAIETVGYWLSLLIVPLLVMATALMTAYLAGVRVGIPTSGPVGINADGAASNKVDANRSSRFVRVMLELTFKRRLLEVILDFVIIVLAYYMAFVTRYGLYLNPNKLNLFLQTLPIAVVGAYLSFYYFGIYKGVWRYIGVEDLFRYLKSAIGCMVIVAGAILILFPDQPRWPFQHTSTDYSFTIFVLFGVYLFLGLAASRSSFRIMDSLSSWQTKVAEQRILIYGASDAGEMALRWILINPDLKYKPIGFIDDDQYKIGRKIHGVEVLGGLDKLDSIIDRKGINGMVLAGIDRQGVFPETGLPIIGKGNRTTAEVVGLSETSRYTAEEINKIIQVCHNHGCWVQKLRMEFEPID